MSSSWFKHYRYSPHSDIRLICFPYAGGSAAVFDGWQKFLPENVDLLALQSPGRGSRFVEPPIGCLKTLTSELITAIKPYLDKPFIFFGHSNGALICFELARSLQRQNMLLPQHTIISAKRAPHLPKKKQNMHLLENDEFIEELRNYNGTPSEILENDELMDLFIPMLKADFAVSETFKYVDDIKLNTRVSLFCGTEDQDIPKEDMLAWQNHVSQPINYFEFEGGHFFLNTAKEKLIEKVIEIIRNTRLFNKIGIEAQSNTSY